MMNGLILYIGIILLASTSTEGKAAPAERANQLEGVKTKPTLEPIPEGAAKNASKLGDLHIHTEKCFPSDAFVRNEKGNQIQMKDIKIGEKVLTMDKAGRPIYSEIIMMLHRDSNRVIDEYVKIKTKDDAELTLSTYHLLALSSAEFVYSKDVRPGQKVTVYNAMEKSFHESEVISVELVTKTGLHAPLSMEGTLVVNDIYASCYASFPSQTIAHAAFSLWRGMYTYFSSLLSLPINENGIHWYPRMLMSVTGIFSY